MLRGIRPNVVAAMGAVVLIAALVAPVGIGAVGAAARAQEEGPRRSVPVPEVTEPVTGGVRTGGPFLASLDDLAPHGYVEEERFVSGSARDLGPNGLPDAPYTTRVLVRRPVDPTRFNGTVLVEWFNVTSAYDLDVDWAWARAFLMRHGYAYVGVSAQAVGVVASPFSLKSWDPVRYAPLLHPGDPVYAVAAGAQTPQDHSFDVFSQAVKAVRSGRVLPGLQVRTVLAAGESQSTSKLAAYLNRVLPVTERLVDGYYLGASNAAVDVGRLDVPVLRLNTDNEARGAAAAPRDARWYRHWEVAGAAHAGMFQGDYHGAVLDRDMGMPPGLAFPLVPRDSAACQNNRFPKQHAVHAAIAALRRWATTGQAPPSAPRIAVRDGTRVRDRLGNSVGGIRYPAIEAPTASHNDGEPCVTATYGRTDPFPADRLRDLYPSEVVYRARVAAAADRAVRAGFLLAEDAREIAATSRLPR